MTITRSVFFLIDNISTSMLNDPSISTRMEVVMGDTVNFLRIEANIEHNNTMIQCGITIAGGREFLTDPVQLRVQGMSTTPSFSACTTAIN